MGCGDCCAKCLIITINTFFFLIGLVFVVAGIVYFVGLQYVDDLLESFLEGVSSQATGNSTLTGEDVSVAQSFMSLFLPIFIALLVFGFFILLVSILAMCGSCCDVKCMLVSYVIIIVMVFVAHLVIFLCFIFGVFNPMIRTEIQESIDTRFIGIKDKGSSSVVLNAFMTSLDCCGMDSYRDFNSSVSWDRQPDKQRKNDKLVTPVACCMTNGTAIVSDYECAYNPINMTNNMHKGCWSSFHEELVEPNKWFVIGITIGFLVLELLLAALTICVISQLRKKK